MEQHRQNPLCATCHRTIDPRGFSLENFDALGRWRGTSEAGTPIDAAGTLADGTAVDGPAALRQALVHEPEAFVRTVTEKLLTYVLGRGLEYYDQPAVRKITRAAAADDYRWSSIILESRQERTFSVQEDGVMIVTKKAVARRTVLRGLGATLALPLLDGMVPALSALSRTPAKPVVRLGAVYVPNGIVMQNWTPAVEGAAFELTPILQPLRPFPGPTAGPDRAQQHAFFWPARRPCACVHQVPDWRPSDVCAKRRALCGCLDGPARREGARCAHATRLPRTRLGRRRFRWLVRQRL